MTRKIYQCARCKVYADANKYLVWGVVWLCKDSARCNRNLMLRINVQGWKREGKKCAHVTTPDPALAAVPKTVFSGGTPSVTMSGTTDSLSWTGQMPAAQSANQETRRKD